MKAKEHSKKSAILVSKESFAIIKSRRQNPKAFANITDHQEITSIINEKYVIKRDIIAIEKGYQIITFDMVLPFTLVGFLARISSALAKENIGIFAISCFSTDHILVKKKDLSKAIRALGKLGFKIQSTG